MIQPFEGAWALLDRARHHTAAFDYAVSTQYSSRKPYTISQTPNAGSGFIDINIKIDKPLPTHLSCIVFDAINCLRSALDYAVYAAVQVVTGINDPQNTKFPFGDTYTDAEKEFERNGKGVPASLRDFILDFQPYENGNRTLWGFNKVRNAKIHRALAPVAIAQLGLAIGGVGSVSEIIILENHWDAAAQELTIPIATDMSHGMEIKIAIQIAFDQRTPLPLKPVVETLYEVMGITSGVIAGLEREAARVKGLSP